MYLHFQMKRSNEQQLPTSSKCKPETAEGYVHNVSPMKQGKKAKYFTFKMQTKYDDDSIGVGFNLKKRQILKEFEVNKIAVKIDKIKTEIESTGNRNYIVSDRSVVSGTELDFPHKQLYSYKCLDFNNLHDWQIGDEEYVITAAVVKCSTITQTNMNNLSKQNIVLASGTREWIHSVVDMHSERMGVGCDNACSMWFFPKSNYSVKICHVIDLHHHKKNIYICKILVMGLGPHSPN